MYTADEKKNAIQKYIDNNYNATKTVRELGYPSVPGLLKWYNAYYPPKSEKTVKPKKERRVYTPEEKQHAIDLYFKNGCNLKKTVRELGYGSQTGVLRWLRDTVPDKVSKPVPREWRGDYSEETKQSAVLELCSNELTPNELCQKYGISRTTLYEWKIQYIGKGKSTLNEDKKTKKSDYIKQIEELQSQKEAVERELSEMKKQLYKAHLEKDVYEKAAEILKKEMGDDLKDFSNREKAIVIEVLRHKYPVKEILLVFEMAKSSFCYQQQQLKKEDKFAELRKVIINIFDENKRRYGYRRIHIELKKIGWKISEKIVRRIMKEEHLEVRITKRKRYSSYMGEISPAVANKINRDFHSSKPNEKWLTDITEFNIGEKKVYLSPIIDCFDGLPVTWTIGTSPNAELVNTMLDNAIAQLDDGEKPIVHSDRGCHYRWPGWGCGED